MNKIKKYASFFGKIINGKLKLSAVVASLFVASSSAVAQTQVAEFNPGVVAGGVNYVLPKTGLKVDVSAMRVKYTPGEYAKYANRYLHIVGVATEPSTNWTVTSLRVTQTGEPDTLKMYTVKLKDKTIAPLVQLTRSGILVAVNTEVEIPENQQSAPEKRMSGKLDPTPYMTEDILSATSTAKMAELTAQEILDIRESKNAIKRGQVESMPKDGESLKIVLDALDLQERSLMQMFVGYTDTLITSSSYSYLPTGDVDREVLFRFSRKLGFVDADDLAGAPYYLSVTDKHTVPLPDEKAAAKRKIVGLVYNMPSLAKVTIENMQRTLYDQELPFAQFGTIDVLSPTLFNKGVTTKLTLNPVTGGILHLEQ